MRGREREETYTSIGSTLHSDTMDWFVESCSQPDLDAKKKPSTMHLGLRDPKRKRNQREKESKRSESLVKQLNQSLIQVFCPNFLFYFFSILTPGVGRLCGFVNWFGRPFSFYFILGAKHTHRENTNQVKV